MSQKVHNATGTGTQPEPHANQRLMPLLQREGAGSMGPDGTLSQSLTGEQVRQLNAILQKEGMVIN